MGIQTTFKMDDEDETFVAQSTLESLPKAGEKVWFLPSGKWKSCEVVDVCHWVSIDTNNNYHAVCVYLKEI